MTLIKYKGKPQGFTEYSCILREIKPNLFVVVSFKSITSGVNRFTDLLKTKEILTRLLK